MTFYCGTCNEEHYPCESKGSDEIQKLRKQVEELEVGGKSLFDDNSAKLSMILKQGNTIKDLEDKVAELEHCVENRAKQWAEQHIKIQKLEVENTMLIGEAEELKAKVRKGQDLVSQDLELISERTKLCIDLREQNNTLTLQVAQLREALEDTNTRFSEMVDVFSKGATAADRKRIEANRESLNTTPNADEWIRKDRCEGVATVWNSSVIDWEVKPDNLPIGTKLYRIKAETK